MKISIITPCFNAEKTIEKSIQSVVSQRGEIEYIVVDGRSTDKTLSIVKRYSKKYPDIIRYISEKDNNMTEALNKGLKMTTGEVVACLNADDVYLERTFEKIRNSFKRENYDVVMGNTVVADEKGGELYIRNPKFVNSELAWEFMGCLVNSSAVFFKKELIDKIGYFNEDLKYTQDYEFYLRTIKSGAKIFHLNHPISKFTLWGEQLSDIYSKEMLEETGLYIHNPRLYSFLLKSKILVVLRLLSGVYSYRSLGAFKRHLKRKFR
ncbi:MAG: glycosyltransferase [Candidatus Dadabacteria bacterium]|nr:glycosyltransferase [Candidatus Dadabacteria bacterium]